MPIAWYPTTNAALDNLESLCLFLETQPSQVADWRTLVMYQPNALALTRPELRSIREGTIVYSSYWRWWRLTRTWRTALAQKRAALGAEQQHVCMNGTIC